MNNDFEVHKIGTSEELKLARALANECEWCEQVGGVMPSQIRKAYKDLKSFYERKVAEESYTQDMFKKPLQNNLFGLEIWK